MRPGASRSVPSVLLAVTMLVPTTFTASPAGSEEAPPPSVRLFSSTPQVTAISYGGWVWLDPGVWVASVGGDFDLRVSRAKYERPIEISQVDPETGQVVRDLPEEILRGWRGIDAFIRLSIRNQQGKWVGGGSRTFCPNNGWHQRIDDTGPAEPRYPRFCASHPLTRGMVWGIDRGWAVGAFGWNGIERKLRAGKYTLKVWIKDDYRDLFEIPDEDGIVTIDLTVKKSKRRGGGPERGVARPAQDPPAEAPEAAPDVSDPDPGTLPDLVSHPAWGFSTFSRKGRDYLGFAATEWNAGPAPFVVEGFRQPGGAEMDAYQYFYEDGAVVGRASVGTMAFHEGGGHHHWHFEQFARYSLLDRSQGNEVVRSRKQSWCLVPTDPVDLTVEGADWSPVRVGFETACGGSGSIWVRETLEAGWGDTYFQSWAGQAFNITGLPNGTYLVRVQVNPDGSLYDRDSSNDTSLRRIKLRGKPGQRRVIVPLWKGIDTERGFFHGWGF